MTAHVIHDLYCRACGREESDSAVLLEAMPTCCGEPMRVSWAHGRPPGTDVLGSEVVSQVLAEADGTPLRYTSARERDAKMRAQGFQPCGDRTKGARTLFTGNPGRKIPDEVRRKHAAGFKPAD